MASVLFRLPIVRHIFAWIGCHPAGLPLYTSPMSAAAAIADMLTVRFSHCQAGDSSPVPRASSGLHVQTGASSCACWVSCVWPSCRKAWLVL